MSITEVPDPSWYADTGATAYMTNNSGILDSISSYDGKDKIYVGYSTSLDLLHTASASLPSIHLNFI